MKSLKGVRPLSYSHLPLPTCEWLAQVNTIHEGPLDWMKCQAEGYENWQRAELVVELPHDIHCGSAHTSPGTCSSLNYVSSGLDLTLNFGHFFPELQVKDGNCIHVVLGEKFCFFFRGSSAYLQGSCYASGESPIQLSLSSEETAKETGNLPFNLCFQVVPDLTRLAEDRCGTWSIYSFLSRVLTLSSSLFPLKSERYFIIKRFGSFMIH